MGKDIAVENSRFLVVACLFLLLISITTGAINLVSEHSSLEIQKHLKRLNKPPFKSIQSPDGDIIDCILANQQPAFDHPLLKDHVIQMKPSSQPEGVIEETKHAKKKGSWKRSITQLWHVNETCPDGTVAIRRTKEEDLLRANSLKDFGKKKHRAIQHPNSSFTDNPASPPNHHEYAVVDLRGDKYYGAKATINLWKPEIQQPDEFSLSQLWITAGSYQQNNLNTIEVGWQAYPNFYGDSNPRLFNYWTNDAYQSAGCYNLKCSGFVQVSSNFVVGGTLSPVSQYGGSQYDITVLVWMDKTDGKWWLKVGDEDVGYWPSSLFTTLKDGAAAVQWGGEIVNLAANGRHTATDMGSGHFPQEGSGKASYFKTIKTVDASNSLKDPTALRKIVGNANCYDLQSGNSPGMGTYFYHGGPGYNPSCP